MNWFGTELKLVLVWYYDWGIEYRKKNKNIFIILNINFLYYPRIKSNLNISYILPYIYPYIIHNSKHKKCP